MKNSSQLKWNVKAFNMNKNWEGVLVAGGVPKHIQSTAKG